MNRTHNEAIEMFETGNREAAWEIAKRDEGLSPHVSKRDWMLFAVRTIERRKELAATHASYANGIGT